MTAAPSISSTPASPTMIARAIGGLDFALTPEGLVVRGLPRGPVTLTIEESLALFDFTRTAGARSLVNRSWLAQQHAEGLAESAD